MKPIQILASIGFSLFAFGSQAQTVPASQMQVAQAAAVQAMADGEIRKIDKENSKLTIKHGPLQNLDMPAMTMVFQVQDTTVLDKVQVGDKVKFIADKVDGKFTVTKIEPAR